MKLKGVTIPIPDLSLLRPDPKVVVSVVLLATVYWHLPSASDCLGYQCYSHTVHDGMTNSENDGCHVCKMFEMMFKSRHFMTTALSGFIDSFV